MSELNWRALTVEEENRSAIYDDSPDHQDLLDAFDATTALEILATFAGAWGSLHHDARGHRWQYRSLVTATGTLLVLAFRGVTLDKDQRWVVVDDVQRAR